MRVCLIGATHPCHNPRLMREADSLLAEGHDVRVVAPSIMSELERRDQRHLAHRRWKLQTADYRPVGLNGRLRALRIRGRRKLAHRLFDQFGTERIAEWGYVAALPELKTLASKEPADWFIAHSHAALPVAFAAANSWDAQLGFDCEDLLSDMRGEPHELIRLIEKRYLHRCKYVSVPSLGIGARLKANYGIHEPLVLYNSFPTKLASGMKPPVERTKAETLRLHWFSQTIGEGRGIEEGIDALGRLDGRVELHLRGAVSDAYRTHLLSRVNNSRHNIGIFFRPRIDHDDLIRSMETMDVGLALERRDTDGVALTVSNKLFSYLLAGLAVAATDTPGQREVLRLIPGAGFLYPPGEPTALATGLQRWIDDRQLLRETQQVAWDEARKQFCWDIEQRKLLHQLKTFHPRHALA